MAEDDGGRMKLNQEKLVAHSQLPTSTPDFRVLFESAPALYLVLTSDFAIVAVSDAYLSATMTNREEILGRGLFEVFPDNPADLTATGVSNLRASLDRVLQDRLPNVMAVQKYDIRRPESEGGGFEERYWSPVNCPVMGTRGEILYIIHRVEDVTEFVRLKQKGIEQRDLAEQLRSRTEQMEAEIYLRAQEVQEANRQLQSLNDKLQREIDERKRAEESLQTAKDNLEASVRERTAELAETNTALKESKARLQTIVENLVEGVSVSDLDGQLRHFNRAALEMHGFASLDECRRHLAEFGDIFELSALDGTVWSLDQWPLSRILRGEDLRDLEARIRRNDSNWKRVFSYGGTLVRDGDGQPMMAIVTIRDITERKRAETKLQSQLACLDLLHRITRAIGERQDLQSIFQVVIRSLEDNLPIDFGCVCLYDAAAEMLTVTSVGVRSKALAMELAMTERACITIDQNGLSRCVHGQLVYEPDIREVPFPFAQRLARGELRSLVAAPLLVESKVFGVLLAARRENHSFSSADCEFLRQLSEQVGLAAHQAQLYGTLQQAYDDLRQTQHTVMQQERLRALGQMASGIAHDINNAISPVALYTESLLEREPNLSERARDYLVTIQRAIEDVAGTVAGMREFYRQREPQLVLAPIDLNLMVQQVIDLTRVHWSDLSQRRGIDIKLQTELSPDLPTVMGAQGEIRDALTNLIFNAVDAMPEGGTLTVRTRASSTQENQNETEAPSLVYLEVCDTGVGMDEETRRRCLEPFYTTKGERGTGLGLAMVYGMVERHSAQIEIESEPGRGTTVCLIFAVSVPIVGSSAHPSAPLAAAQRLLLVDDDPLLIKSLRDTLEGDGHFITTADGGQTGIDIFVAAHSNGETFDAVITDLGMPYVDGRKVAAAVKAASPSTPVILLTGWGQRLVAENDIPVHVDRVLSKPPKLQELRATLVEVTAGVGEARQ